MNLEKLTLKEKIEKLEYTSYDTFIKINELTFDLLTKSVLLTGDGEVRKLDIPMYSAATNLGLLILSINGRYKRNGINIKGDRIFTPEIIKGVFPEELLKIFKFGLDSRGVEKRLLTATSDLIKGIETELNNLPVYKREYASKELEDSIKEGLENVKEYAGLCSGIGEILIGTEIEKTGDIIKAGMERLTHTDNLLKKIKDEKFYKIMEPVISIHSELYKLPFDGDVWPFMERTGEQIDWAMYLAKEITELRDRITDSQVAGRKKFLSIDKNGLLQIEPDSELINGNVKKYGLADTIAAMIIGMEGTSDIMYKTNAPFLELESQLKALGVPYELAKKITDHLSYNLLSRDLTGHKKIKEEERYEILAKEEKEFLIEENFDKYAEAIKIQVEKIIGKKIPDISLCYFEKEDAQYANSISSWVNVTKTNKYGKTKKIYEANPSKSIDDLMLSIEKEFPKPEYEIFVFDNTGVCFVFDQTLGYTVKVNFRSVIEAQNNFERISEADNLAGLFYKTEVMAHETTHASQIDSRLLWRNMAVHVAYYIAKLALKENKKGRLDYETPYDKSSFKRIVKNKRTWRKELIDELDEIAGQALGIGKFAENCRQKGVYDALIERGATIRKDGTFNSKYFSKLELEDSKPAKLIKQIREAIEKDDMKKLSRLKRKAENYNEELSTIVETMAETFGIIVTEDFIKNYPGELSEEKKQHYIDSLKARIIGQGINGETVTNIMKEYREDKEKMEEELNKKGFTYKRVLSKYHDQLPVEEVLINLDYNPLNPLEAYENMDELEKRIKKYNKTLEGRWKLKDLLYPINTGRVVIDNRYRKNIPMFLKIVDEYGAKEAHGIMLNAQSLKELERLAR